MGIFSRKKTTYVTSVAYSLGEDDDKRVPYLKQMMLNATLQERPVGEAITQGYLRGQGMSLRNAFHYARDHYTDGVPTSAARYFDQPDLTVLTAILQPKHPGSEIRYLATMIGTGRFEWWAEQYLTEKYGYDRTLKLFVRPPDGVEANANVAYDLETSGVIRILLMNADGATKVIDFRPEGYSKQLGYVQSAYQTAKLFTTRDETTTRPANAGEGDSVSTQVTIIDRVGETQSTVLRTEIDVVAGTATVHVTEKVEIVSRPQYFIYQLGKGTYPTLDALASNEDLVAPYYPSIPLRVNNVDMTNGAKKDTPKYKTSEKLLKKVGVKLDEVADAVRTNPQIGDIDFAFITFGVMLNTTTQEGQRYLYRFFEHLRSISKPNTLTKTPWTTWFAAVTNNQAAIAPEVNVLEIYSTKDRANNHDIKIQWDYIDTTLKTGVIKPNARPGDVEISMSGTRVQIEMMHVDMTIDSSKLYARKQLDENTYEELEISGLVHENFIYQGKSVVTSAYDAFHDPDDTGFIVPLNQSIVRTMPIREITEVSYQCVHIVFNCYKVVKQKWYQTTLFKIILVIIAVIIIVVTWGAGTPAAVSMLSAAFVAVGVSLLIAQILAALIYVLAMMVIMNILTKVAVKLFGPKWGPIIATVVGLFVGSYANTGSWTAGITNIGTAGLTASNIIMASSTVLNLYGGYMGYQAQQAYAKMGQLEKEYSTRLKTVQDLIDELDAGNHADLIDIQGYQQATWLRYEPMQQFLDRTLMTGSDVCEITNGLIENFTEVGLQLPTTG